MKHVLVLYGSCYGATKQYADDIASQLGVVAYACADVTKEQLAQAELIIYGGGVYAGKLKGAEVLRKQAALIKGKPLAVFSCGLADPTQPNNRKALQEYCEASLKEELASHATYFYLRGGQMYSRMSLKHRMMMKMMVTMLKKKQDRTQEDEDMIQSYGTDLSFYDETSVEPIIAWAKQFEKESA